MINPIIFLFKIGFILHMDIELEKIFLRTIFILCLSYLEEFFVPKNHSFVVNIVS